MDHDWEQMESPFVGKMAPVRCRKCGVIVPAFETDEAGKCFGARNGAHLEELDRRYAEMVEERKRRAKVEPGHSGSPPEVHPA